MFLYVVSNFFFCSEAPPDLSTKAKKNSRGAPSFAERKTYTNENQRPETQAGENGGKRYTLNRLHRKATRKKAAGRQCTTAIFNEGAPKGSTRVQRDRNAKAAA